MLREASRMTVLRTVNALKRRAQDTDELPAQIIRTVTTSGPPETHPYLPSSDALRQTINRLRHSEFPVEPTTLGELNIPEHLTRTLDGTRFLVRDSIIGEDRVLLFTTIANIRHLQESTFWIMDGTFKTVPNLFMQLYTIHGRIGTGNNSRIVPLVFSLMSRKTEACYRQLFQDLIDYSDDNGMQLQPRFILTDFEQAAINAARIEFVNVQNKGCHFHLAQNVYRKVQAAGLSARYNSDEPFSMAMRQLPALAFLSPRNIPAAFDELRTIIPTAANDIVLWFEETYIRGRPRRSLRNGNIARFPPLFPPTFWSVVDNMEYAFPRTQNSVEAWHRRWDTLVGSAHVGVFKIIEHMRKEQSQVMLNIEATLRGAPRPRQRRQTIIRERRIRRVFNNRNQMSVMAFLRGIAHNICF